MNKSKAYTGIDSFRLIAAFLVIAIHTSPLTTYTETGDFILTRILARTAVPFFFMTSGFFLISEYARSTKKLRSFVKKTAMIYALSIVIYLPVNIYNHYFAMDYLLPNMVKDLLFDGTMYHLWYLPAAMIGAVIAWYLVRKTGFKKALPIALLLYAIGLLGDSYYGAVEKLPWLRGLYAQMFELFDYTRNGIFYAPVFFVMGGMIAEKGTRIPRWINLSGFGLSLILMAGEGMLLHRIGFMRHDCMYLFLLPCVYFLFRILLSWRGRRRMGARTAALVIYLIHPMMIVGIRLCAKMTGWQKLLVDNSLTHFLAVSIASVLFSVLFTLLLKKRKRKREGEIPSERQRAWVEVDTAHLAHNIEALKGAMPPGCELMAVVKAGAYGHGAFAVAACAERRGVKAFAVATLDEGIALRRYGIRGEILILGYTSPARAKELSKYDLMQTLLDFDYAARLNRRGYAVKAHIKIDTGMHRLGFSWEDAEQVSSVFSMERINICGIYTHLCVSDSLEEKDAAFTGLQTERFYHLLDELKNRRISIPKIHIQSSYGLLNYPELTCDYVRAGIALYGVLSSPKDRTRIQPTLLPVLSLKAAIVLIREIKEGDSVGYGRDFVAERDSRIAVLPVGYADGVPRSLSGKNAYVLVNGRKAPIAGRICMDQLCIDITDIPNVRVGMTATLIGRDGDQEIAAPMLAERAESITNELLSRMGGRLGEVILEPANDRSDFVTKLAVNVE